MSDLPDVADVPDYGEPWEHEEARLQWERAVAAALAGGVGSLPLVLAASEGPPNTPVLIVESDPTQYDNDFFNVGYWQVFGTDELFRAQELFVYTQNDNGDTNADVDLYVSTTDANSAARLIISAEDPTFGSGTVGMRVDGSAAAIGVGGRIGQTDPIIGLADSNNDPVWRLTPQGVLNNVTPTTGWVVAFDGARYTPQPVPPSFPANRFHMGPTGDETGIAGNGANAALATAEERHNGNDGDMTNGGGALNATVPTSGVYAITFSVTGNTEDNGGLDTFVSLNCGVTINDNSGSEHVRSFGLGTSISTGDKPQGNLDASVSCVRYIDSSGFASVVPFVAAVVDGGGDHKWTLDRLETSLSVVRVG